MSVERNSITFGPEILALVILLTTYNLTQNSNNKYCQQAEVLKTCSLSEVLKTDAVCFPMSLQYNRWFFF